MMGMEKVRLHLETGKFRIIKIRFNLKAKNLLGLTTAYYLKNGDKFYFLGYKYDISDRFREAIKEIYGNYWSMNDIPKNFLYNYIHKKYIEGKKKNENTKIKKKPYYMMRRIQSRKDKIKRLKEEIKMERKTLKRLQVEA